MGNLTMYLGERRKVTLAVTIGSAPDFTIISPTWELTGNQESLAGSCAVDGHNLSMEIEPSAAGYYTLTVSFGVATEKIKRKLQVLVME